MQQNNSEKVEDSQLGDLSRQTKSATSSSETVPPTVLDGFRHRWESSSQNPAINQPTAKVEVTPNIEVSKNTEVSARADTGTNSISGTNPLKFRPGMGVGKSIRPNYDGEERLYFDGYKNLRTSDDEIPNVLVSIRSKLRRFTKVASNFVLPVLFVTDFLLYLAVRFRVVFVLSSVLAEVIANQFENVKKLIVRHLFWGRGNIFKFAVQFVAALLVVVTIALSGYRARITDAANAEVLMAKSQGYSKDLAAQYSSTKTILSDSTTRYEQIEYIVKGGDTMSRIAEYYEVSVDAILWANEMTPYDVIRPGMKIMIPPGEGVLVEVKDGDTLEKLAEKYKANPQAIIEHNHLSHPFTLAKGQSLFLPGGSIEAPKPVKTSPIFTGVVNSKAPGGTGSVAPISNVDRFLGWPVANGGRLTQCYSGYHNGIDIADKSMPTIVAAAPGVVTLAGCQSGNCPSGAIGGSGLAWTVIIDHGNGFSTVYGHLQTGQIYVKNGDVVSRGQALGQMGQSGLAYGIHLHFMLVQSGTWKWQNPAPYMMTKVCGY